MVVFASFMVILNQSNGLEHTAIQTRQMDNDRAAESVTTVPVYPEIASDPFTFKCKLQNTGTLTVEIMRFWIEDLTTHNIKNYEKSIVLTPGEKWDGEGANHIPFSQDVDMAYDLSHNYHFWFVSARGNTFTESPPVKIYVTNNIGAAQGMGSILMDFNDFKYFDVANRPDGQYYLKDLNPKNGYSVNQERTSNTGPLFRVKLTNVDWRGRDITINDQSVFWILFPGTAQQPRGAAWYMVDIDTSTGRILPTVPSRILPYSEDGTDYRYVYFAAKNPISASVPFEPYYTQNTREYIGLAAVNLALVGTINGESFGQNLPFVSLTIN